MDIHEIMSLNFIIHTLLFSSFILLLVLLIFIKKSGKKSWSSEKLPPSPPKFPIIGHLLYLVGGQPHYALRRLAQKYGHILLLQFGEVPMVVISSREAAEQVLKVQDPACADRHDSILTRIMWYDYKDMAFSPYNDYWKQMRKICVMEMLSAKNVRSFEFIRQDEVSRLVESIREDNCKAINVTEKIAAFTNSVTCRVAFGKVVKDRDFFVDMFKKMATMVGGFELADLFPSSKLLHVFSWNKYKLLKMHRKLDRFLDHILEEHELKQSGEFDGEDFVDALLRIKESGDQLQFPVTNVSIKAILADVFSAGSETSSTTFNWVMTELMRNPRVMEKVQAEVRQAFNSYKGNKVSDVLTTLTYLKLVIKETFRLHPPIALLPRAFRDESVVVDGYSMPLKCRTVINIWSLGRDPEYWHEPEVFQPERFENNPIDFLGNNFEFIPFGAGRRICPGQNFGLANIELPLAQLLYHFDWKLPKGITHQNIDMSEASGLVISRKNDLFLIPELYSCPSTQQ
ncbi:hypothetical protein ACJIZ3_004355 [Penstemon smallii]|uniref:Cytochrome P450 n=1 Tax=Penstemon smallii TaxID=265156 RepID=A0ABD3S1W6_9LAMI